MFQLPKLQQLLTNECYVLDNVTVGKEYADSSLIRFDNVWWMYVYEPWTLHLYYCEGNPTEAGCWKVTCFLSFMIINDSLSLTT